MIHRSIADVGVGPDVTLVARLLRRAVQDGRHGEDAVTSTGSVEASNPGPAVRLLQIHVIPLLTKTEGLVVIHSSC